ncbi:MAG: Glutathione S-transferase [Labilithrix sp.]|nr:Glutathione S-transferase [Labilithrix sp.]
MTTPDPAILLCEPGATTLARHESYSPVCLQVHRALKLVGLRYRSRHGGPADLAGLDPEAQVPALLVGEDEVIVDKTRILARLEALSAARGGPSLLPLDARAAAEAWLWEDYGDRALSGFVLAARWADDRNWPAVREAYFGGAPWLVKNVLASRVRARVLDGLARDVLRHGEEACWDELRRVLDHLESLAPHDGFWVTRDAPSVADLSLFAQLHALRTPLTERQAREVALRPALTDWLDRVDEVTFSPRAFLRTKAGLTALPAYDMTDLACPSPIPIRVLA